PHCLARERLSKWTPSGNNARLSLSNTSDVPVSEEQLDCILEVMGSSWAQSTKETYGVGLLVFHVYCDSLKIPEDQHCPVSPTLLLAFLSSCAGSYSGSALANYTASLKAWHLLHGHPWIVNAKELKAIIDGAMVLVPESSKCSKREPFTIHILSIICSSINLSDHRDTAIFACITTTFYAIARAHSVT
ncbi:uncharacterized protein F5147DRAFT_583189, partial [Suillus discolor]